MCGRYAASRNPDQLVEEFEVEENELEDDGPGSAANFNVAPTTDQPVVITRAPRPAVRADDLPEAVAEGPAPEPKRTLRAMRWGLIPSWAKDASIGNRMINARSESIFETSAYRKAIVARRCLIPADGWYEWQKSPSQQDAKGKPRKQPFFVSPEGGGGLAFGGVYELWRDRSVHDDDPHVWVFSYSIITTAAEPGLDIIHERMPMVIDQQNWGQWLDPELTDPDGVRALLQPHEPGRFVTLPVSTRVNNVRNNGPELLAAADPADLLGVVDPATGELIGAGSEPLF